VLCDHNFPKWSPWCVGTALSAATAHSSLSELGSSPATPQLAASLSHSSTAQQLGADARQLVARTPRCSSTTDYRGSTARRCSNLYRSSIARHSLTALQFGSTRQLRAAQRTLVAARQLGVFSSMSGTNFCVMGLSPQVGCSHTPSGHTRCRARGCVRGIRW